MATPSQATPSATPSAVSVGEVHWHDTLRDGSRVLIRPLGKEDIELERAFLRRLSPTAQRMRFLGLVHEPSEALLRRLTDVDFVHDVAFVALVHRDGEKREVGVSRYSLGADGACECAVTVSDDWQGKGLGTLLMQHLIEVARAKGVRCLVSIDAADNAAMRDLAAHLGFARETDPDDPHQVIHRLDLQG